MAKTYTDAPVDFDGFGTATVAIVGRTQRGPVRLVETPGAALRWQRDRYASGGVYIFASEAEWPRLASVIEPV